MHTVKLAIPEKMYLTIGHMVTECNLQFTHIKTEIQKYYHKKKPNLKGNMLVNSS